MDIQALKKDILSILEQSADLLGEIPVVSVADCRRKITVHDNLTALVRLVSALEFKEKETEDESTETDDPR